MRLLDLSYDSPARNLALDEALLLAAERGQTGEWLRFWESSSLFVVLGVSQQFRRETHWERCARDDVPVLRRCSAGGCVLQGPGSLNFSLILEVARDPELETIRNSYCYILARVRDALAELGFETAIRGTSDLAIDGMKFSGNAQRRKRRYILHHGTILYRLDALAISDYLKEPEVRPEYRGNRRHTEFMRSLEVNPVEIQQAVAQVFSAGTASEKLPEPVETLVSELLATKYSLDSWNLRR